VLLEVRPATVAGAGGAGGDGQGGVERIAKPRCSRRRRPSPSSVCQCVWVVNSGLPSKRFVMYHDDHDGDAMFR
jgi:hypothetical protein